MVGSVVAPLLGFVTVSVQMRGTGCSGGAFDLFGLPSDYDGYDVVQTVGAQPWVLNHKVGMVGISYSGFSQLVVAGTDPPDLAAITPLSPTDDLYSTGYPGGIYNDGFAASWVAQRVSDARPAPGGGQPWAIGRDRHGRQDLPGQPAPPSAGAEPRLAGQPEPRPDAGAVRPALADRMGLAHQGARLHGRRAQDEQVGPQWPALITALHGDKDVYVTMMNGTHTDSLGPDTISRWLEFLDLYVADRVPTASPTLDALAPTLYSSLTGGAPSAPVPAIRFTTEPSVAAARAAFAAQDPRVRVLFDNGGGNLGPGALQPTYEAGFSAWPPAGTVVHYGLGPDGTLQTGAPPASSTASFRPTPAVRPADDLAASANAWAAQPPYDWTTVPAANGIAFETPAFTSATTDRRAGQPESHAALDRARHRPAGDGDRGPPGRDAGGVRHLGLPAQQRPHPVGRFDRRSTPCPTYLAADRRALPKGRFTLVRIPVDPIAHTFRAGTRLRIVISAPGGDRPSWTFDTPATHGAVLDTVALGGTHGSSLVVNEVGGVVPSSALPACGALRGEPCRAYAPLGNQG